MPTQNPRMPNRVNVSRTLQRKSGTNQSKSTQKTKHGEASGGCQHQTLGRQTPQTALTFARKYLGNQGRIGPREAATSARQAKQCLQPLTIFATQVAFQFQPQTASLHAFIASHPKAWKIAIFSASCKGLSFSWHRASTGAGAGAPS